MNLKISKHKQGFEEEIEITKECENIYTIQTRMRHDGDYSYEYCEIELNHEEMVKLRDYLVENLK